MFSKTIFLFVGTGGGIGKTLLAANLFDWLRFRCLPLIRVRGFDLDFHGGLSRFAPGVDWIGEFKPREIFGSIVADQVHSCFIIDTPGGSRELVKEIFSAYPVEELAFDGVRVVFVIPVTGDRETLKCVSPWMEFGRAEIVLVYRKPGPGVGAEIRDSADLRHLALPLWLEIAAGRSGEDLDGGDQAPAGECRVKRLLQPQLGPQYLVDHLCSRGISLYQAAYPYSARTARELPREQVLLCQKAVNGLVGYYWSPRKRYHGIGLYYGYQLSVYLGFLCRQFAMVLQPLVPNCDAQQQRVNA